MMELDDLATDLIVSFSEIRKMNHFNVKDFGPAEIHVGHILFEHEKNHCEPINAKTIATITNMSKPVLSRVMKSLEQKEMVERIVPAHNHRIVQYALSKKRERFISRRSKANESKNKIFDRNNGKK